ncbi:tetratricopeptide repeat protein [Arsukibacterium perlucidum]|uniref:tetratricopeptide repeat protein n=1 Tax=Arsukibacterium perlucidum TaxID=368811 RepID=UPI0003724B2F|nr:tetratricopeptide repeat protein [Arsukibacterium perlucidum]
MTRLLFFRFAGSLLLLGAALPALANRYDNNTCDIVPGQPLTNAYGPFDATNPAHADKLPVVLRVHFTPDVERLVSGATGSIMGDINYTLKAIPNYHRALAAIGKYQRSENIKLAQRDNFYTADCYFLRAIYFQPADAIARMLFAMHLHLTGRLEEAVQEYNRALLIAPDYSELHYNFGLLLLELKRYDEALAFANKAYAKGFPLPGLKNKLAETGRMVTVEQSN